MRTRVWVGVLIFTLALTFSGVILCPQPVQSQNIGSTGAQFLNIKAGPRATSLGGAYTALSDDGYGMYWNPAGMSRRRRGSFVATHQEQLFEVFNELLGVTYPIYPNHTVGMSSRFRWDEQRFRTQFSTGNKFTNYGASLGLNYAYGGRTGLSWGIGMKGIQSKLAGFTAKTYALDLGLHYQSPRTPLKLGLSIQNLGPDIKFIQEGDPLPRRGRFGWAYDFYPFRRRLTVTNDIIYLQPEKKTSLAVGVEFMPFDFVELRSGVFTPEGFSEDPRFNAGLGVNYKDFQIDYAFASRDNFSDQHRFSLSFDFGRRPEDEFLKRPESLPQDEEPTEEEERIQKDLNEQVPEKADTGTKSVESLNVRADIHFESGEYKKAVELWKESLSKNPLQRDVMRKMGIAYYELGQYEKARQYMKDSSGEVREE